MTAHPLPDADNRAAILEDIDANLVVEAAAGTGKTTCLVGRLMTLFRRGALAGEERLAAVTFTHKAASELRERLEKRLDETLRDSESLPLEERRNLEAAAAALPECHIGTIHSFCARLLREHPVEAGVGPDFRELDDEDDMLLRRQAWNLFAGEMRRGDHSRLYRVFETFGLDQAELEEGFLSFAEYPDVAGWPGRDIDIADINVDGFVGEVELFAAALAPIASGLRQAEAGNDELLPALRVLLGRLERLVRPIGLADAHRLARLLKENPKQVQKQWLPLGVDRNAARELLERYAAFYERTVKPFRQNCLAAVYRAAMDSFDAARRIYDRLRSEQGLLNFQDLLMLTARLLRDYPLVRNDLAGRYSRLLLDEVQDTDPVQAEIMFLLAAERAVADWRKAKPRPGSLFIVGDPKQSIYRFRRADIVVYQEVKRRIVESGGRLLGLSANFRSQAAVIDWVNRIFGPDAEVDNLPPEAAAHCGRFSSRESKYGPAYIPLQAARATPPGCFHGVYALETLAFDKKAGILDAEIFADEAARIAAFIRHAVDSGLPLPESGGGVRPARPGDFLVVTYQKSSSAVYAEALRRRGLACRVSGGGALKDSPTLRLLLAYIQAMAEPDNPILLVALLRSALFGVSDRELFRWKRAGGEFSFLVPPRELEGSPIPGILRLLAEQYRRFRRTEPVLALSGVVDELGLWAHSCLGDDPDTSAGVMATAVELLGAERIPTVGKLAERLSWLIDHHEEDALPARESGGEAVRVMNLHKTKGLEAPVVFLTCTRKVRSHKAAFAIRRDGGGVTGGLAIRGGENRERLLAQPPGWDGMSEDEERFLAAEKTRLNYVAATRAGAALVVSVHLAGKVWQSRFLPHYQRGVTIADLLPEPEGGAVAKPAEVVAEVELSGEELAACAELRRERLEKMLVPSYRTVRAKPESDWPVGEGASDLSPERGMNLGEVLHSLLEFSHPGDELRRMAVGLLGDYDLPGDWAGAVAEMAEQVWRSEVWRRAELAEVVYREAPFTRRLVVEGVEVLERGVIDLVFREAGGWVIVDYKADHVEEGADLREMAGRHGGQLGAYVEAWGAITGEEVVETGIYFLRAGVYVRMQ